MTTKDVDIDELIASLKAIRRIVDRLASKLDDVPGGMDPYERRRDILQKMYWHQQKDLMTRSELLPILDAHGTDYRWIGQQVKKGYLIVLPVPDGEPRYAVTNKAVLELKLSAEESPQVLGEGEAVARLSEASFGEDWDSEEDAVYDKL